MKDVCVVVEGTYPRTVGGVSTWVQQLTEGMPEVRFSVARIVNGVEPNGPARLRPAANVDVLDVAPGDPMPEARMYHAASTGLAGVLAARTSAATGSPLVVTEHGLAWREASFPFVAGSHGYRPSLPSHDERAAWQDLQLRWAREAYAQASAITTVCASNAALQRNAGARAPRVIENAAATVDAPRTDSTLRVGLVGRVTPVKDVLGFVRACALVAGEIPHAEFVVVGPLDHDESYAEQCRALAARLNVRVRFVGEAQPEAWFGKLDVVALTSLSEAQPLALLEAMGAGIPVVATDVGGCRDLVAGAGLVVPPASPRATAAAIVALLRDAALRERLGAAGRARVRAQHDLPGMVGAYRAVYAEVACV